MATRDRRSYKELVGIVETRLIYIDTHLKNIDSHLERLNDHIAEHGGAIATNKTSIVWLWRIIGLFVVGLIGVVIKLIM